MVPFKGKYAVKDARVFERIRAGWEHAGMTDAPYRPLRIELELTTKCNDACPSCGMGALSLRTGATLNDDQIAHLVDQFEDIALPSIAITGGEPFVAMRPLLRFMSRARGRIDISKLTTNGVWGSPRRCGPTFDRLVAAGLLENKLFVPLLMISIGEQTTPLDYVCRIIHHAVSEFSDHELNVAMSSLANPADRQHKVYALIAAYERVFGDFPHDRVHSTMRVYLPNDRLADQKPIHRPGTTPLAKWMNHCYDCFAPTVGAYVLPTALMKHNGDLYTCAAFNVPEKLRFGNLFAEPAREIIARINRSEYVVKVRHGGGLKALHDVVPSAMTESMTCGSYCGSCALLIEEFEYRTGAPGRTVPLLDLVSAAGSNARAPEGMTSPRGGVVPAPRDGIWGVLSATLAHAAGNPATACVDAGLRLDADLGLDSLALLELIETLQGRFDVTVLDEDIGQIRTVGDLRALFERLMVPQPHKPMSNPDTERTTL